MPDSLPHDSLKGKDAADVREVYSALEWAYTFFVERDRMNAAVHCSRPRWSPVTDAVMSARNIAMQWALDVGVLDEMGG